MNNQQFERVVTDLLSTECISNPHFGLTPAEIEVATGFVRGLSYKEIADSRGVQIDTVKSHIRNILSKTSRNNRLELIFLVLGLNYDLREQPSTHRIAC